MSRQGYHRVVAAVCRSEGWPVPTAEYVFAPPRRWRFDLSWPAYWLAVEIQGGTFIAGRHVRAVEAAEHHAAVVHAATAGDEELLLAVVEPARGRGLCVESVTTRLTTGPQYRSASSSPW